MSVLATLFVLVLEMDDDEPSWWIIVPVVGALVAIGFITREITTAVKRRKQTARELTARRGPPRTPAPAFLANQRNTLDLSAVGKKLRSLQRQIAVLEAAGMNAENRAEAVALCEHYLAEAQEALRANNLGADVRVAWRSGVERARAWHKRFLLELTRLEAQNLLQQAQHRARVSDKIETAAHALEMINSALRQYPEEGELRASADAVRDFIASIKIGHWVELAERAAFRGKFARAVARYQDALFFLSRVEMSEGARNEAVLRLNREIDILRARMASEEIANDDLEPKSLSKDKRSPVINTDNH